MKNRILVCLLCIAIIAVSVFGGGLVASAVDSVAVTHGDDFIVKENMEIYSSSSELYNSWKIADKYKSATSLSLETEETSRVYGESGKSLKLSYDFSKLESGKTVSIYYNDKIYNDDLNGNPLGLSSRLGFWIYTENDIELYLIALDSVITTGTEIKTNTKSIEAGYHFITFDWDDFALLTEGTFEYLYQLQIVFSSAAEAGNIWFDEFGIVQLDCGMANHAESFYEINTFSNASSWVNKNSETATLYIGDSKFYHKGSTNIADNAASIKIAYSDITDTQKSNFYYNSDLRINKNSYAEGSVSDNLYGEDTVLALWVRADRALTLEFNYADKSLSNTTIYSNKYSVSIGAGENIVKVPLSDLVQNKNAAYFWVYQLQFWVSNTDTTAVSGNIYIDAIGYYNSDTDNELAEKISSVAEITPETADDIKDILCYYRELDEELKKNITSRTMFSYNKLLSAYEKIAPQVICPDTLEDSKIYEDGTLTFDVSIDNGISGEYTVAEIGAVMHRKQLVASVNSLTKETENSVYVSKSVSAMWDLRVTVIFKCFDGATDDELSGYFRTDYLIRAYVTYKNSNGDSFTVYSSDVYDTSSDRIKAEDINMSYAFDSDTNTYWEASGAGEYTVYYDFGTPKTFNTVSFQEKSQGEYNSNGTYIYGITYFTIDLSDDGKEWYTVYRQDEMGNRTAVLDKTYTAAFVRINLSSDMEAGICEVSFENTEALNKSLRVLSYLRSSEDITGYEGNIAALTDITLIDYGSWDTSGEYTFSVDISELESRIAVIRAINPQINIWFSMRKFELAENETKDDLFSSTANTALIEECLQLCRNYKLCGIDFDFEYPEGATQISNYNNFLNSLGSALHNEGYKLSVATSDFVNHTASAENIDYVNLMAYDRIALDRFGRHNSYNAIYRQINKLVNESGFKREQILLGLGYYGKPTVASKGDSLPYKNLVKQYYENIETGSNMFGKYYCAKPATNCDKVLLALQQDLNGVFSWSLTTDLPIESEYSLAGSVKDTISRFTE